MKRSSSPPLSSSSTEEQQNSSNNRTTAKQQHNRKGGEHAPVTDLERVPRNLVLDRLPTPFPLLMDGNRSELGGEIDRPQSNGERMEESEKMIRKYLDGKSVKH